MALPVYEDLLSSYHAAFEHEIRTIVSGLPLAASARAADVGSGDGFFAGLLAERLSEKGRLTCLDASEEYLEAARRYLRGRRSAAAIDFRVADVRRLPYDAGAFDFVWCAQSLYSFGDPVGSVREMGRVLTHDGVLAVLEDDIAHQVLLPWPPEVELELRTAELATLRERTTQADRFYVGRGLAGVFVEAGLHPLGKRTFAWDRMAPFDAPTRQFLDIYVAKLREQSLPNVTPELRSACAAWLEPGSPRYILDQPACNVTVIDHLLWGSPRSRR